MSKTFKKIRKLIRTFDKSAAILQHEKLFIELPEKVFRSSSCSTDIVSEIDNKMKVRLFNSSSRSLVINIKVENKSKFSKELFLSKTIFNKEKRITEFEFSEPVVLSAKDSIKLIKFLVGYFEGFDLSIKTTLSK